MTKIVPAILPKDFKEIAEKVPAVSDLVKSIQIDFCDGSFVPNKTWPYIPNDTYFEKIEKEEIGWPEWDKVDYEFDLMIANPVENFEKFARLGPARMIFHFGSFASASVAKNFFENIEEFWKEKIAMGLAILPSTDINHIDFIIPEVSFVQVMGIERIGFQGEKFTDKAIELIKTLRAKYPDLEIGVDGGVNLENAKSLADAGANRLAVGSAIWESDDPVETIEDLKSL